MTPTSYDGWGDIGRKMVEGDGNWGAQRRRRRRKRLVGERALEGKVEE